MINPIMFTIHIGSFSWPVRWYGVILMTATVIAAWLADSAKFIDAARTAITFGMRQFGSFRQE